LEPEEGCSLFRCGSGVLTQSGGGGFTIQTFPGWSSSSATVHVVRCMPVPTGSECTTCAVAVKEVKAQLGTTREGTERMDHAAVATHLDGIEISGE
jgi:hypothetical protein